VSQVQRSTNPGSLALSDLRGYEARERTLVCGAYERWRVCGAPPPSAGGIAIAQILGTLQALEARDSRWSLAKLPPIPAPTLAGAEPRPEAVHLIAEVDRLAHADRGLYVADPDFVPVDIAGLTDRDYFAQRAQLISDRSLGKAPPGVPRGATLTLAPDRSPMRTSTSQVVAVDDFGGAASTTTVEHAFGSHLMVEGFVLSNQLTDFSFLPCEGGKQVANCVAGGKRPRSSMAPTLVFDRQTGDFLAALGSVGGSQIIEYVAAGLVGVLDWNLDPQAAINLPNFGSRSGPTEIEKGLVTAGLKAALVDRGHSVSEADGVALRD
jgi:gamma-glutamyltranspeptidase/glutathione hydrolase